MQVIYQGTYRFPLPNTGKRVRYFSRIHPNSPGHIFERFLQFDDVNHLGSRHRRQPLQKVVLFMQYRVINPVSLEKPFTILRRSEVLQIERCSPIHPSGSGSLNRYLFHAKKVDWHIKLLALEVITGAQGEP
jgi:hypothetical protein